MKFSEVIGQDDAKQRLLHLAHEERVPHALLLCGPAGCGKMALAMAFASYMLCRNHIEDDACGNCPQCSMLKDWAHPDLHFSFPVIKPMGMSAEHKMSSDDYSKEWRHMLESGAYFTMDQWLTEMNAANQQAQIGVGESISLLHKLSLKSSQGGYKISIIWLPERMNSECANKMLKIIEEPPSETLFMLVSEEPEKLLDTIKSRAQRIDIKRIDAKIIEQALIERRGIEPQAAHSISRAANGSWLHALEELAADNEKRVFFEMFVMLMRLAYTKNIKELRKWSDSVAAFGREKQKRMLLYFLHLIRENFIYNFNIGQLNYMNVEEENFARNFSRFVNEANIFEIVDLFNRAIRDIGQNANAKIVFFDVATRLIVALMRK
ncbi:MAG: ATP-binding protein [Prevotella sp.]